MIRLYALVTLRTLTLKNQIRVTRASEKEKRAIVGDNNKAKQFMLLIEVYTA